MKTSTLIEKTKRDDREAYTNLLDPNGKPYLVLDQNSGRYYILYWKAWFENPTPKPGLWHSSGWYDEPNPTRYTETARKANSWPKRIRVWELPGIMYDPPRNYTDNIPTPMLQNERR